MLSGSSACLSVLAGRRGRPGCPQESHNGPQVPPRNRRIHPLPFRMSRTGRRGRADGEGRWDGPVLPHRRHTQMVWRPERSNMTARASNKPQADGSRRRDRGLMETEGTLSNAWDQHLASEFAAKSADQALATMTADPHVNLVPLMIGARGRDELYDFYANHFLSQIPPDMEMVPVSRTIGQRRVVDELIMRFT